MKNALLIILICIGSAAVFAQPRAGEERAASRTAASATPLSEKELFEKAAAIEITDQRIQALLDFLKAYPESEHKNAAGELIAASRLLMAEDQLNLGRPDTAVQLFKLVVEEAPHPYSNEFFAETIAGIPATLFWRGQRASSAELATLIESKAAGNTAQLLHIAKFYLNVENSAEAMRITRSAIAADAGSAEAHRTLALAHRLNFELEESAAAYARSLELEPSSVESRRGLAEMKRALGKPDESIALYRELLTANENDLPARTGLVLSLFNAGKKAEAEAELARSLEKTPSNVILLAGAAYWYAASGDGPKAVELAKQAIAFEPRYIWSHIALARGHTAQKNPVEAERVLVMARQYGNFPTLEYEIAAARAMSGFYRDAAEDLRKFFTVSEDSVTTRLGGRVLRTEKDFADLIAHERKASIFEPASAIDAERSAKLRELLYFTEKLNAANPVESEIAAAAAKFADGTDKMRVHRQLFAADAMLRKKLALPKVVELTKAAAEISDSALDVPNPNAAVMASELYDSRSLAFSRGEFLLVPEVPRQTLSAILRGSIEEMTGWALYYQNSYPEAVIRLKRAISVLPPDSAWWRSSMWRLGAALEADGKHQDALDAYISSYKIDRPDFTKYVIVEALYKKVNGNTDGLDKALGIERVAAATRPPQAEAIAEPAPEAAEPAVPVIPAAVPAQPEQQSVPVSIPAADQALPVVDDPPKEAIVAEEPAPAEVVPETADEVAPLPTPKSEPEVEPEAEPIAAEVPVPEPPPVEPPAVEQISEPEPQREPVDSLTTAQPAAASEAEPTVITEEPVSRPSEQTAISEAEPKAVPVVREDPLVRTSLAESKRPASSGLVGNKPLFEPVVITIPRTPPVTFSPAESVKTNPPNDGSARSRLISGAPVTRAPTCRIGLSLDNMALLKNGGNAGLLVRIQGGDLSTITSTSSSPKDLEVIYDPDIAVTGRRFYVIRTLSGVPGVYQVKFAAPCGSRDLIVTVR